MSGVVPEGYEAWAKKAEGVIKEHPEVFNTPEGGVDHVGEGGKGKMTRMEVDGKLFVGSREERPVDEIWDEWDGEADSGGELEGTRTREDRKSLLALTKERPGSDTKTVKLDPEPMLTVEQ